MASSFSWFPGHMVRASNEVRDRIDASDLIVEVRDARVPVSSSNSNLEEMSGRKNRLIVLNKRDLANRNLEMKWRAYFERKGQNVFFSSSTSSTSMRNLLDLIRTSLRSKMVTQTTLLVMVVGIPNVGKSSIINSLHRHCQKAQKGNLKQAKVGPLPGVTRTVSGFNIGSKPSTYILDTPGIMVPRISSFDVGMNLALIGSVKDSVVGEDRLGKYLLTILNSRRSWRMMTLLEGNHPEFKSAKIVFDALRMGVAEGDDHVAKEMDELVEQQVEYLTERFNYAGESEATAANLVGRRILKLYRAGLLGKYTLDSV